LTTFEPSRTTPVGGAFVSNERHGERDETVERLQREVAVLRASRRRVLLAGDADRRALERSLHAGVQQHLVALAIDLQRLTRLVGTDPGAAKPLLDELTTAVRQTLDEAAKLAQQISPPLLEARGLASALRSAAAIAGISAHVEVPAGPDWPPEIAAAVYWCGVEALSGAPAGTHATVTLLDADGAVSFEVAVAGDYPEERLDRLRDRVEALGGRLTSDAAGAGGTRIYGSLPVAG
jgi:signal transduction histidine kinase